MTLLDPKRSADREIVLPRWAIPIVWAAIVSVIQILLPWVLAGIGPRLGWSQRGPAWWNIAGLLVIAVGLAVYTWCLVSHFRSFRAAVRVDYSPPHLVTSGLYRYSRNPTYVSGVFAWLGWTIFYGSPAVLWGLVLLWITFTILIIPREEHQLDALFGN